MINITFPDGSVKAFEKGVTGYQIAESISPRLAAEVLAVAVKPEGDTTVGKGTVIGLDTHIGQQTVVSKRRHRHCIGIKHIRSLGRVPVKGYVETLLEHRQVETGIKCLLYLPFQIRITVGGNRKSSTCCAVR